MMLPQIETAAEARLELLEHCLAPDLELDEAVFGRVHKGIDAIEALTRDDFAKACSCCQHAGIDRGSVRLSALESQGSKMSGTTRIGPGCYTMGCSDSHTADQLLAFKMADRSPSNSSHEGAHGVMRSSGAAADCSVIPG